MTNVYLFLHLVGAFLIMGGGTLGEVVTAALRRTKSTQTALALLSLESRVVILIVPGALLTVVFGVLLVMSEHFRFGELWVNLAFLAWLLAAGVSIGLTAPAARRLHDLAEREAAAGREDSAELQAAVRGTKLGMFAHLLSLLIVIFLVLMVFKPGH